jgi:hypothetical protein
MNAAVAIGSTQATVDITATIGGVKAKRDARDDRALRTRLK